MERAALVRDAPEVAGVIAVAQESWRVWAGGNFTSYEVNTLTPVWTERIRDPRVTTRVWDHAGHVQGVVSFGPEADSFEPSDVRAHSAHLSTLFVHPSLHGGGAAQALHDSALHLATTQGYSTMRLWVPAGAIRARRFYERNRWLSTAREIQFAGLRRLEYRREVLDTRV